MYHAYWFGVTYTFTCAACHEINFAKAAINSETTNTAKLNQQFNRKILFCQYCRSPIADGVHIDVEAKLETPESLKNQGFPLPADI
jgi:hypothetical protein